MMFPCGQWLKMTNMDLYTEAAGILEKFENKQGTVKSLVFATEYKNIRQLYALVCESLKYQAVLLRIFKGSDSLKKEDSLKGHPHLATVLLYEHLVGKGLGRAGKIRSCIVKHKREIQQICAGILEEKGVASLGETLSSHCQALNKLQVPRYARVNLLKTTLEDVVTAFTADGWDWRGPLNLASFHTAVESLGCDGVGLDPLLPDLLVFPPGTDLHDHPLTSAGNIVLQDRASCFPAHILNPPHGATVLDCCAAPGNKTSHAASLMGNSGKILAYERDAKRMSLLKQQLRKAGVTNTSMVHQDFLSVNPNDEQFADVQYILVDPSCSGSGIISRMDHITSDNASASSQRLLSLQRFQISILKHALHFPAARRIVYSTCSIYEEENEAVIREVAEQVKETFQVKNIFPEFTHRGKGNDKVSKCCLRMSPKKDLTNGFFVACFERVEGVEDEKAITEEARMNGGDDVEQKEQENRKKSGDTTEDSGGHQTCLRLSDMTQQSGDELPDKERSELTKRKKRKKAKSALEEECSGAGSVQHNGQMESELQQSHDQSPSQGTVSVKEHRKKKKSKKRKTVDYGCGEQTPREADDSELLVVECDSVSIAKETAVNTKQKRKKQDRSHELNHQDKAPEGGKTTTDEGEHFQFVSDVEETARKQKKKRKKQQDISPDEVSCEHNTHGSDSPVTEQEPGSTAIETPKKHKKRKKRHRSSDDYVSEVKASVVDSGGESNEERNAQTLTARGSRLDTDAVEEEPKRKKKKKK